jgi:hypothetical protein
MWSPRPLPEVDQLDGIHVQDAAAVEPGVTRGEVGVDVEMSVDH